MMAIKWTKELSVGNEVIDSEHRNLISLANDVVHAIEARNHLALVQALETLGSWLQIHLVNEEKIAHAAGFDFSSHKPAQ
ncbi:MAG: hypothetical protein PHD65_08795 [Gallionella sp.]|nr:hypothetical protein [Gallionella sp.]